MRTNLLKLFVLFLSVFLITAFKSAENLPVREKFVVVLDAGHGGKDPGNMGGGHKEKDIALNIVLKIGKELEKNKDFKVIYTRDKDVFIPLDRRAKIANNAKADLFISIHCNAHSSQAQGTETFVLGLRRSNDNLEVAKRENSVIYLEEDYEVTYNGFDPNSPESYISLALMQEEYLDQSVLLADFVQKKFTNDLKRTNRGVKQDVFLVLRETVMPSVLIETGFLTNTSEGAYLNSATGQTKMADAIVKAIIEYSKTINMATLDDLAITLPGNVTPQAETAAPEVKIVDGVTFKVQLAASSKKIDTKPQNFKGLQNVNMEKEGKLFKYYYGATSNYTQIEDLHQKAKKSGFPDSYVVAFKDGKKITVNAALNSGGK